MGLFSHFFFSFSQFDQMERECILVIFLGQNQRWIQPGPHEADPASGSVKGTASLLRAINCFSSSSRRKRGFRIASHAPCAFALLRFTRTREEEKGDQAAHAYVCFYFQSSLNFSLDHLAWFIMVLFVFFVSSRRKAQSVNPDHLKAKQTYAEKSKGVWRVMDALGVSRSGRQAGLRQKLQKAKTVAALHVTFFFLTLSVSNFSTVRVTSEACPKSY